MRVNKSQPERSKWTCCITTVQSLRVGFENGTQARVVRHLLFLYVGDHIHERRVEAQVIVIGGDSVAQTCVQLGVEGGARPVSGGEIVVQRCDRQQERRQSCPLG